MKPFFLILYFLAIKSIYAQPNPQIAYPERIATITKLLKTNPNNYELIWERLEMKVSLMGGFGTMDEVFALSLDSLKKTNNKTKDIVEIENDFKTIFKEVIQLKHFDIVEEGDFYLNRVWFKYSIKEIKNAIQDAIYLRDYSSYSRYDERGDYYKKWALFSLFSLYIVNNQYDSALKTMDTMLLNKKQIEPQVYYSGNGSFLSYTNKIQLFEHFHKEENIIPFLKENCKDHFKWYIKNVNSKVYYMESVKENSLYTLRLLVGYMQKFNDIELNKYETIYNELRFQMNENYETLNPNLSLSDIKVIISKMD